MRVSIRRCALAVAVVVLLAATGCRSGEGPEQGGSTDGRTATGEPLPPAYGDALVSGTIGDASNLIPMFASDSASSQVASAVFDGLLSYDKHLSDFEPRLADRWEVGEDGLEITFHLRKDVRWQDGEPFDVDDVLFALEKVRDPAALTPYGEDYRQIEKLRRIDDHTLTAVYEKPFAPALGSWGSNIVVLPEHLLAEEDLNRTPFSRAPVGLGEYRFEAWKTGEQISALSNHDYYRGRPYIERLVWKIIPDQQTLFLELKGGGIDTTGLTPLQFRRQTETAAFRREFNKFEYFANGYTYLGYNNEHPLFRDARVRRALTHAIDRDEIIAGVLLGLGTAIAGPYQPGTDWVNESLEPHPYDPERAKSMLAELGWTDSNGDGVLDKGGERFEFEIITNNGNEQRLKSATIIQRRLKAIGVEVSVKTLEWSAFLHQYIDKRRFDATILGWSLDPDPDQYIIWHSSKTAEKEFNFVSYANAEVDELLEKGRRTFDKAERKRYYDRFQEILHEEQPYTFLYVGKSLPAVHKRFHGIEPAAAGIGYNLERWYVPRGLQKYTITQDP